ncbi:MAG: transposase family protein [Chloroflexota bacterium]|nr:transposase family protein [Chloroflexota bacterium]
MTLFLPFNGAFFAVFYKAVRSYGVPEVLVSDNGSVFISHVTRRVCEQLGIEKKERCILSLKIKRFRLNSYEPSAMLLMEGLISGNVLPRPLISGKGISRAGMSNGA